ncbi:MAG: RluA family pseudouridine synthase [Sphaerochaetaceae bacterium]|jgi:23S rRNA pseudouridine1911/1915/1917 synthase
MMSSLAKRVLYEDNHLIIINKEVGELTQGDQSGDRTLVDNLKEYLKQKYNKPGNVYLGVIHRLDRPTSGIVIYAKTEKALSRMNALFSKAQQVKKTYWAVVDALPQWPEGVVVHHLVRNGQKNKSTAFASPKKGAKEGRLSYTVVAASQNYFLLEVELHTGRHHQIRAQLAAVGSHIKGDVKYGFKRANEDQGIHLHARMVSFLHPVQQKEITVIAPPPRDPVWDYFNSVAGSHTR